MCGAAKVLHVAKADTQHDLAISDIYAEQVNYVTIALTRQQHATLV